MIKNCVICGDEFTAQRSTRKYCGRSCRSRASQRPAASAKRLKVVRDGDDVGIEQIDEAAPDAEIKLFDATLAELAKAGRADTALGLAALLAARRLDQLGLVDTGAGVAALIRAHREALTEAVKNHQQVSDPMQQILESAALKLLLNPTA